MNKNIDNISPLQVMMGTFETSYDRPLVCKISTCVSVCLYHRASGLGAMTHISKTPSTTPRMVKEIISDYSYPGPALKAVFDIFYKETKSTNISLFIAGGLENEEPVKETCNELGLALENGILQKTNKPVEFQYKLRGDDINGKFYRELILNPLEGTLIIKGHKPFQNPPGTPYIQKFKM